MTSETKLVEVFRELSLCGPAASLPELRAALLRHVALPWLPAEDRPKAAGLDADVVRFQREAGDNLKAATLVLFAEYDRYKVANIVPTKLRELSYGEYNAVLQDFLVRIAAPAVQEVGFRIETTASLQSLDDWLPIGPANALRAFSRNANKSTGSSDPMDQDRWFKFLIEAHANDGGLDTQRLARWLIEVEGWGDDEAHDLAIEYEFGLALLGKYDQRSH